jgi:branched-chain amino acid transport system permease protein
MSVRRLLLRAVEWAWPLIVLSAGLFLVVSTAWLMNDRLMNRTVTEALISIVLVVGLYIFIGNSGVVSFGHIGFAAIAAYADAWQTCCLAVRPLRLPDLPSFLFTIETPALPAAIISALIASLVALLFGAALMRLSGLAASIGTFCFLAMVNITYTNWEGVTAGTSSLVGIPTYVNSWVALGWALVAMTTAYVYQRSSLGLSLRASRDDEVAARAAGVNILGQRLVAFILSAFFVGIGGVLIAHFIGTLSVDTFYLRLTFITIAMLAVGGLRSLSGAVVGVVALSALTEFLREFEAGFTIGSEVVSIPGGSQEIGLGIAMLLILLFRGDGITRNREIPWPTRWSGVIVDGPPSSVSE